MRKLLIPLTLGGLLLAAGCAKDPSKDAPAATVSEPAAAPADKPAEPAEKPAEAAAAAAPEAPAPAAAAPAAAARAIPLTGSLSFVGSKVTGSHVGVFKSWKAEAVLGDKLEDTVLKVEADVATVVTDEDDRTAWSQKLDDHLKSEDFFHAERFPKATFESTGMAEATPEAKAAGATHMVTGRLTLRGVTKDVTFPATIAKADGALTGKAEFSINRKDFGIEYAGKPDDLIREGVVLKIDLKGTPEA